MSTQILPVYPTPVYVCDKVDNFNSIQRDLTKKYNEMEWFSKEEDWGFTHYLSKPGFLGNIVPSVKSLENTIHHHVREYITKTGFRESPYYFDGIKYRIVNSWFAKFEKNCYAHIHNHGHADISGAYYFKMPKDAAEFFITSPVPQFDASLLFHHLGYRNHFSPTDGTLIMMPGFLNHGVKTSRTEEVRCSVAFNIVFERKEVADE